MSITSANALITLTVPGLFVVPVQLQGFAADDIYDSDDVELATTIMGVDGILSGGYVFSKVPWHIIFQADSISIPTIEAWVGAQDTLVDVLPGQANVTLPGISRTYQMVNGIIVRGKRLPDAKKTLMPRKWSIEFQRAIPVPVGAAG